MFTEKKKHIQFHGKMMNVSKGRIPVSLSGETPPQIRISKKVKVTPQEAPQPN